MNTLQKSFIVMLFLVCSGTSPLLADNAIYIDQIGSGVDIDITQDGSGNKVGGSADDDTKMIVNGDNITMSIDTVGSTNSVIGNIVGEGSTIDIDVSGSTNTVDFNVDPTNTFGATDGDYTLNISGGNNDLDLNVGTAAAANNGSLNWTVDGDFNSATIDVDVSNFSNTLDWMGDNNTIAYDADGYDGHTFNVSGSGNFWDMSISQQSTLQVDELEIELDGDGTNTTPATICISQSDSGTATGCQ